MHAGWDDIHNLRNCGFIEQSSITNPYYEGGEQQELWENQLYQYRPPNFKLENSHVGLEVYKFEESAGKFLKIKYAEDQVWSDAIQTPVEWTHHFDALNSPWNKAKFAEAPTIN